MVELACQRRLNVGVEWISLHLRPKHDLQTALVRVFQRLGEGLLSSNDLLFARLALDGCGRSKNLGIEPVTCSKTELTAVKP